MLPENRLGVYFTQHVASNFKRNPHRSTQVVKMASSSLWTADAISELISHYQERPCLYDTKIKDYFDRDKRSKALAEIAELLKVNGKYKA